MFYGFNGRLKPCFPIKIIETYNEIGINQVEKYFFIK
jgi:hypothetical protein